MRLGRPKTGPGRLSPSLTSNNVTELSVGTIVHVLEVFADDGGIRGRIEVVRRAAVEALGQIGCA